MVTRIEATDETMTNPQPPRIDLNRADAAALVSLPGIGPKLAARIVDYRDEHGPFLFEEDITQVEGIGPNTYEELAEYLTITIPTTDELAGEARLSLAKTYGRFADNVAAGEADAGAADNVAVVPPPLPAAEAAETTLEQLPAIPATTPELFTEAPQAGTDTAEESLTWEPAIDMIEEEPEGPPVEHAAIPMPGPVAPTAAPVQPVPAPKQRSRFGWFWTALLGAVLGAFLGLGLSMLVFAGINGSIDVTRSTALRQVNGQLSALGVQLDAVQGDVGTLQGDLSGLRQRVEVLSGLTARMEQAEETLATFTKEIQALETETDNLTASFSDLSQNVDTMSVTLDAVEAETEKATTFFEGLQQLLQEIFTTLPEPESAAPRTAAPQTALEVNS